jgi:prepilin-type processing-associated H-X9-DG protein
MRIISALLVMLSLIALPPRTAWADVTKFIDANTAVAGEVDLTKVDPAAFEQFILGLANNAKVGDDADVKQSVGEMKKWLTDMKAAGATQLCLIGTSNAFRRGQLAVIVPVADDKAPAIVALFNPKNANRGVRRAGVAAAPVPGVGVVYGPAELLAGIKTVVPAERADFKAAFTAAGDSPIKIAIAPGAAFRAELQQNAPPMLLGKPSALMTRDIAWIAASAAPPPQANVNITLKSANAQSAKDTLEAIQLWFNTMGVTGQFPPQVAAALNPQVKDDKVVATLAGPQFDTLAQAMAESLARSRQVALRIRSASNMRQLLQGTMMYQNDNKGQWPEDLKALEAYMAKTNGPNAKTMMTNPRHPNVNPGYVYIKPARNQPAPAETAVMYETFGEFGDGVNVGFADGHVEFVANQQDFEKLLAKQ